MSVEMIVILGGVGVVALAILILRMGKQLAILLLVLGGLVVAVTVVVSMFTQASANRQTAIAAQRAAEAAQIASSGQSIVGAATSLTLFVLVLLLVVIIVGGGLAVGCFYLRSQLAEAYGRSAPRLSRRPARWQLSPPWAVRERWPTSAPTIYYVDEYGQEANPPVDLAEWGWD